MLELDIRKRLGAFSLEVAFTAADELAAVFGPSGAGKSLTLRCIAGLLRPDAGRIVVNDRALFDSAGGIDLPPRARRVGYVFQSYALLPHLTVAQNVAYGLNDLPVERRRGRVAEMLATMRLEGLESRRPAELSGGQQQRVAVARALATNPDILLLDEPFSALDSAIRGRLHAELLQLLGGLSITAILVTHNLAEAYTLSKKMIVYDAGKVLQQGSREEVLRRPASRTVARFTGAKNLFRGVVLSSGRGGCRVQVGGVVLAAAPGSCDEGEPVDLCIRPEEIMLIRTDRGPGAPVEENRHPGRIVGEIAHGTTFTLQFKLDGDPLHEARDYDLQIEIPANVYYRLGVDTRREWSVSLKQSALHLMPAETGRPS